MSFENLIQGLKIFKEGMTDLATSTAVKKATDETNALKDQLKAGAIKEQEFRSQLNQASTGLAQHLMGIGAPATTVQNALVAFGPQQYKAPEQALLAGDEQAAKILEDQQDKSLELKDKFEKRKFDRDADLKRELGRMTLEKEQHKVLKEASKEERKSIRDYQKEFNRLARDNVTALEKVVGAKESLKLKNPIADQAIKTLLAKASGEVGNLTEAEREMFAGSPSTVAAAKRLLTKATFGVLPESDRKDLEELLRSYEQNNLLAIEKKTNQSAKQASAIVKRPVDELKTIINPVFKPNVIDKKKTDEPPAPPPISGIDELLKFSKGK